MTEKTVGGEAMTAEQSVLEEIQAALAGKWGWLPTAGPWFASFDGVSASKSRDAGDWVARSMGTRGKTELEEINNVYIAACNPENMRKLLALIQSQKYEIGRTERNRDMWKQQCANQATDMEGMRAEVARLQSRASDEKTAFYDGYGAAHDDIREDRPPAIQIAWDRRAALSPPQHTKD